MTNSGALGCFADYIARLDITYYEHCRQSSSQRRWLRRMHLPVPGGGTSGLAVNRCLRSPAQIRSRQGARILEVSCL